ncbi:DUF167 domain-containing protein [Stagnimonas aquatica]|uniref:UPF0235 protein ED208_08340 n=1 Tax=Stagnimonas aquatica TaxID=2689987 RepID=A0A3N0VDW7_9GAMM|nr:DUF167 domain-containing protein [Stagnimonas aquatica]ROH90973.1 DUF167 domain-containing protein [Stagnimonas aquatica]
MSAPLRLPLKVAPKASRNAVTGWMGETLKLSVTVAPEKGKANQAVVDLLCEVLHLPKSAVRIVRGETSTSKLAEIDGLDAQELHRRLSR